VTDGVLALDLMLLDLHLHLEYVCYCYSVLFYILCYSAAGCCRLLQGRQLIKQYELGLSLAAVPKCLLFKSHIKHIASLS
jgi:hypothetical protein